jgi:hypothetical protein
MHRAHDLIRPACSQLKRARTYDGAAQINRGEEHELVRAPGMCHLRMLLLVPIMFNLRPCSSGFTSQKEAQLESKTGAVVQLDLDCAKRGHGGHPEPPSKRYPMLESLQFSILLLLPPSALVLLPPATINCFLYKYI